VSRPRRYATPTAFRAALTDRIKAVAASGRWTIGQLQRQVAYDRLLERLYLVDDGWVVKGATALLARDLGVRGSLDTERVETEHRRMMPLGAQDTHFNIDSVEGTFRPYRVRRDTDGVVTFRADVRNPLPNDATLRLRMAGPSGERGPITQVDVEAHGEACVEVTLELHGPCRRLPVALELTANGRPFGQIAEALVTIGHEHW